MLTKKQVAEIMEQAQVFASAWSLVGGVFDYGNALEAAEQEKANLEAILAAHSAGAQEPEAWLTPDNDLYLENPGYDDWTPLYAHPQPMPQTDSAGAQEPVAEIVRWLDFTNKPRFDIKVIDKTLEHGAKLYSQPMPQTDSAGARASSGSLAFNYGNALVDKKLDPSYNAQPQPMPQTDAARDAISLLRETVGITPSYGWVARRDALLKRIAEIERLDRAKGE